jgi:hypothetical protein
MVAIVAAVTMSLAFGLPVAADLNLSIGGGAQVSYTNGDGVNVRTDPGYGAGIVSTLPEGFAVVVNDGPVTLTTARVGSTFQLTRMTARLPGGLLPIICRMAPRIPPAPQIAVQAARPRSPAAQRQPSWSAPMATA